MTTKIIVIAGPTSSGKTELAKTLQETLLPEVWLHFSVDTLFYALPESVLARCNNEDDWSDVDGPKLFRSAISCLKSLAQNGNSVIFDLVVSNEKKVKELDQALNEIDALRIKLTCDWEEIKKRTADRGDRTLSEAKRSFGMESKAFEADISIDTTKTSPAEIAKQIIPMLKIKMGEPVGGHNSGSCAASA